MPKILTNLLLSKKFLVALLTAGGSVAAYLGWHVDPMQVLAVASPFLIYIGAQGWADAGKEQALVAQKTALLAQEHGKIMAQLYHQNAMALQAAVPLPRGSLVKIPEGGFAKLGALVITSVIGVVLALTSCMHTGRDVLAVGQCILDSNVLSAVVADLAQPNYAQLIADLATRTPGLVNCALQAVASPGTGSGSGSGSAAPLMGAMPESVLVQRARELLASQHAN